MPARFVAGAFVALAVVATLIATVTDAAVYFPNVPPAISEPEKHSVMSIHHAIVGRGIVLQPNAAARVSKAVGGFQVLARSATPDGPGKLVDALGQPLMAFGFNFVKGTMVRSNRHSIRPAHNAPSRSTSSLLPQSSVLQPDSAKA